MSGKHAPKRPHFNQSKVVAAIQKEIDAIPKTQDERYSFCKKAEDILYHWDNPDSASYLHFAKKRELRNLDKLVKAAHRLQSVWDDIDPELRPFFKTIASNNERARRNKIIAAAKKNGRNLRFSDSLVDRTMLRFLDRGADLIAQIKPALEDILHHTPTAGTRTNWPEIRVVEACALVWRHRTGNMPKSHNNVPFQNFVQSVFDAIETDASAENTIRAWAGLYKRRKEIFSGKHDEGG